MNRGHDECTRDPIFLFQKRIVNIVQIPDGYEYDGSMFWKTRPNLEGPDILELWNLEEMEGMTTEEWYTELVFLTRTEGEAYGHAKHYNYPNGWRVYCVCAEGKLAEILKAYDQNNS